MSIRSFNVTSPEFWSYAEGYDLYYFDGWQAQFMFHWDSSWLSPNRGTQDEYAEDPYAYVGGNDFWEEHANDVLLKITAYGQNGSDGSRGEPGNDLLSIVVVSSPDGVITTQSTSMIEIDYSALPVVVRLSDFYRIELQGLGVAYAPGNGITGIIFTLDVLAAGAELVWKHPMSVREKY